MNYELLVVHEARHQDLVKQAQQQRLVKLAKAHRAHPASAVMLWSGRRLVAIGQFLVTRAARPLNPPYVDYRSASLTPLH